MRFFTADTHFFHQKLLYDHNFAQRDFLLLDDMHETLCQNWNAVVSPTDTVYHLGDIALIAAKNTQYQQVFELLACLNGQLVFVKGNHDTRQLFKYLAKQKLTLANQQPKFVFHDVGVLLKTNHHQLFMTHYPLALGKSHNALNLHGHIHRAIVSCATNINVGVDSGDAQYLAKKRPFGQPFSEAEIFEMAQNKRSDFQKMR